MESMLLLLRNLLLLVFMPSRGVYRWRGESTTAAINGMLSLIWSECLMQSIPLRGSSSRKRSWRITSSNTRWWITHQTEAWKWKESEKASEWGLEVILYCFNRYGWVWKERKKETKGGGWLVSLSARRMPGIERRRVCGFPFKFKSKRFP